MAVDTLGHLLATVVTPASEQERAQVADLAEQVQTVTGDTVELAYVDQGYTGTEPAEAAAAHGIQLEVVKLPEALGPRRVRVVAETLGGGTLVCLVGPLPAARP